MVGPRASVERLLSTKDDMLLSVAIVAGAYGAAFTAKATTGSKLWDTLYDNECSNHIVHKVCMVHNLRPGETKKVVLGGGETHDTLG